MTNFYVLLLIINMLQESLSESIKNNTTLKEKNISLEKELIELKARINKDSHNSSKPPSSDGYKKPIKTKSLRTKSGNKPGGQTGHKGSTYKVVGNVTNVLNHYPDKCKKCQLFDNCKQNNFICQTRRYEADIEVKIHLTEHKQMKISNCPLDKDVKIGEFPDGINTYIQYGPNISSLIVSMNNNGISCDRIHKILGSVYNIPLSTGTIVNKVKKCADLLEPALEKTKEGLINSKIVHYDETGVRNQAQTQWVHSSSNNEYTYLTINKKRGTPGINANGVLPNMKKGSVAVHDFWSPYKNYNHVEHGYCLCHLIRELKYVEENFKNQSWSGKLIKLFYEMYNEKKLLEDLGINKMEPSVIENYILQYDTYIDEAIRLNPPPPNEEGKRGRKKKGPVLALATRFKDYKKDILRFITDFDVPFSNNLCEQSLRNVKIKLKNSGCFRSNSGASNYLKIRSYIDTARKQGKGMHEAIIQALQGNPLFIFSDPLPE